MELLIGFLHNPKYQLRPVLRVHPGPHRAAAQATMGWGFGIPYMITGLLNQHPREAIKFNASEDRGDIVKFYRRDARAGVSREVGWHKRKESQTWPGRRGFFLLAVALLLTSQGGSARGAAPEQDSWIARIRRDHPRLFFNRDTWPAVKQLALGPMHSYYQQMKERVNGYPDDPQGDPGGAAYEREERIAGKTYRMPIAEPAREWGAQTAQTAFVYWMTGDKKYLNPGREDTPNQRPGLSPVLCPTPVRELVLHEPRDSPLAAYDWICSELTQQERQEILGALLRHINDVQPGPGKPAIHRLNGSDPKTGFYGEQNLLWFAGLAAYGNGVNDDLALEFLRQGYRLNQDLFDYRRQCAGDDGGLASATVGYAMAAYPWAQFNFLHTWRSATGENLASQWPHLALFPQWVYWNWIPSKEGPKEFGSGDTYHYTNDLPHSNLYEHMSQIMHFYGKSHPEGAALAAHVRSICPNQRFSNTWPMCPFLMTELDDSAPRAAPGQSKLAARCFESLGQISMRSGHGPDDAYCLFTIGSSVPSHKQYDENNFVIYKRATSRWIWGPGGSRKTSNCATLRSDRGSQLRPDPHAGRALRQLLGPEG